MDNLGWSQLKKMRLDRMLANSGVGSRKEVKSIIRRGIVEVNGDSIRKANHLVFPSSDIIEVDGRRIEYKENYYIMLNKPAGVVTATHDRFSETVIDILGHEFKSLDLFPIGRLDKDTEGLLILTTDGKLAHKLLSPKQLVPKTYFAIIDGVVDSSDIELFENGMPLAEDFTTIPAKLKIISPGKVHITIYEGKFHQIKRMFGYIGKKVVYLKRVQMGNLKLDENLLPGEARELTEHEVELLKSSIKS